MSVIGGQNIPVTNGLVYALDFGNIKSYSSGSSSARSLLFNTNNFAISGSPAVLPNAIELGTSKYLSQPNLFTFNPNQDFTIQVTGRPTTSGVLISTNVTSSKFILTYGTSSIIGFQTPTDTYTKQITGLSTSSISSITYRYRSGSFDFFVNGIPVSASTNTPSVVFLEPTSSNAVNNYVFINGFLSLNSNLNTNFVSGSLSTLYFYNRALTSDEIYQNLLSNNTRSSLGLPPIKPYTLDENTLLYVSASGITNTTTITTVDTFVRGLKSSSLWDKMIAIYPFISGSNNRITSLKDVRSVGTASLTANGLSGSFVNTTITPSTYYPNYSNTNAHISILSYDSPTTQSALAGTLNSQYASGGQIFYSGSNVIHVFTGSGYFRSYVSMSAQVMVVAGGGGGGNYRGAGGGAGGLVYSSSYQIPQGTYNAIIGLGGLSSNQSFVGQNGEDSVFNTIRAFGGGGGGGEYPSGQITGRAGGSGGGSGGSGTRVGGAGTTGQGNNGGDGTSARNGGTGGGGAGTSGSFDSANGGSGSYFPQFTNTGFGSPAGWFAGGGGGSDIGIGGPGGGGNNYASGVANTGGGSGAIWNDPGAIQRGGSGIIIVSYDTSSLTVPSSSFSITTDSTSITGSINNTPTTGIQTGGPLGLITVSRTGSNTYSLFKNRYPQRNSIAASSSLGTNLYLNALNFNNTASFTGSTNIAYASVGAGLTDTEVGTYYDLVDTLQTSLGRGVSNPGAFISTWDTRLTGSGTSNSSSIVLPLYGTQAITASWGDGTTSNISSSAQVDRTHSYATPGIYTVTITGAGQGFQFNNTGDRTKILDAGQWGSISASANQAFQGATNLLGTAADYPPLQTTNLSYFFNAATKFNGNINNWRPISCSNFSGMFYDATTFNQPLGNWTFATTGSISINTSYMFSGASSFNQNIGSWNTIRVTNMSSMFQGNGMKFNNGGSDSIKNWDTSNVTDMSYMFWRCLFNQPIGTWNVGNVTNFDLMFWQSAFNQNIGAWNVEKATSMSQVFSYTGFNNSGSNSINNWRPISCSNFSLMFRDSSFNQPIGNWPISASSVDMGGMFLSATAFNQDLGAWDVSKVTSLGGIFQSATSFNNSGSNSINNWRPISCSNFSQTFGTATSFNQPIGNWPISASNVNMSNMFVSNTAFNQNIGSWDVSKVTNMSSMFQGANTFNNSGSNTINNWRPISCSNFTSIFSSATAFNQPIGNWPISASSIGMNSMFQSATGFNQNIGAWNVEKVTTMASMFLGASTFNNSGSNTINNWRPISCSSFQQMFQQSAFNQPINNWPLSGSSISMIYMFLNNSSFNQPLNSWDTSRVTAMGGMFQGASSFNQDISSWNTSNVGSMWAMFAQAPSFNQPIGSWNVSNVGSMESMFQSATSFNQDIGSWNVGNVTNIAGFMAQNTTYSYLHTIYNGWINNKLRPNLSISFNTIKYSGSAAEGRGLLARTYNTASITGYSNDGGQLAITCSSNHNVVAGNKIFISGSSFSGANGVEVVFATGSATTLTLTGVVYDPTATGGTVITGYGWSITDGGVVV